MVEIQVVDIGVIGCKKCQTAAATKVIRIGNYTNCTVKLCETYAADLVAEATRTVKALLANLDPARKKSTEAATFSFGQIPMGYGYTDETITFYFNRGWPGVNAVSQFKDAMADLIQRRIEESQS